MKKNIKKHCKEFFLMPAEQREGITDSLLLESGVVIFSVKTDDGFSFICRTCGDVRITWKEESYRNRSSFPDELVEAIRDGSVYHRNEAYIDMNNWYELTVYDKYGRCVYSDLLDIEADELTEGDVLDCVGEMLPEMREFSAQMQEKADKGQEQQEVKRCYRVAVTLPLTLWVETLAQSAEEAIENAKKTALDTPYERWGDDFSTASFEIVKEGQ